MKTLPLIHCKVQVGEILVSDEDYDWARQFTWHPNKSGYADRRTPRPEQRKTLMGS